MEDLPRCRSTFLQVLKVPQQPVRSTCRSSDWDSAPWTAPYRAQSCALSLHLLLSLLLLLPGKGGSFLITSKTLLISCCGVAVCVSWLSTATSISFSFFPSLSFFFSLSLSLLASVLKCPLGRKAMAHQKRCSQ